MGYELGGAYVGQIIAKKTMYDSMNGKPQAKKKSFIKALVKKFSHK
ncbi:hypothetical protein L9W80_11565 [Vibrio aestuarianus]|nr:hypothetical protein [Vibrio aestuarianus]MDE1350791.1 hypothetical protein [Vibrio aestuarianus]